MLWPDGTLYRELCKLEVNVSPPTCWLAGVYHLVMVYQTQAHGDTLNW